MTTRSQRLLARLGLTIAVLVAALYLFPIGTPDSDYAGTEYTETSDTRSGGVADTENPALAAFTSRTSDVALTVSGVVVRTLADDNDGSRHQRFILDVGDELTVLVAHNIDLASVVPIEIGSTVTVRGEYVWNDRGGLIHWTHRDPAGLREGGWVEYRGVRYR